jgi:hypothetical protein
MDSELPPPQLMPLEGIKGWQNYLEDGEAYLRTAKGAFAKKDRRFTGEILYNLVAMAIEKFVMAALMRHDQLPYNHTITDLVEAMEAVFPDKVGSIAGQLVELDKYQDICDLEHYSITPPELEEIPGMIDLAEKVGELAKKEIAAVEK